MLFLSRRVLLSFVACILIYAGSSLALAETSFQQQLDKVSEAFQSGKYSTAVDLCNEIIWVNPNCAEAYYRRGRTRLEMSNYDDAVADITTAISLDPNNPHYYLERGHIRYLREEFQSAAQDASQSISLYPKYANAYVCRALARQKLGDNKAAIEDCTQAIKFDSRSSRAYYLRSIARGKIGDHKGEAADKRKAIRLDPQLDDPELANAFVESEKKAPSESVPVESGKKLNKCCDGKETADKTSPFDWGDISEVDARSLERVLKDNPYVVVFCYANWCGPCVASRPVVRDAAVHYGGKIKFVRANTDDNHKIADKYRVKGIPEYVMISHSEYFDGLVGAVPLPKVKEYLDRFLASDQSSSK
jgi:thioredoxin-like negative regulator of GroEL